MYGDLVLIVLSVVFKTLELTLCRLSVSVWQVLWPPVPGVREDIYICK